MDNETRSAPENSEEKRKVDILEVLVKKCTGTVKWYSHKLLYGFISRNDNQEDVFVHRTAITASKSRTPNLRNGEEVEFSVVRTTNGIEAADVTGPDGSHVQGFILMRRRRRPNRNGPDAAGDSAAEGAHDVDDNTAIKTANPRSRRRPRRGRGGGHMNGDANGTHSEGDVYYEPNENDGGSPSAGQSRPIKREPGTGSGSYGRRGRGGFRGGRGGMRPYNYRGRGGGNRGAKRGGGAPVSAQA